MTDGKHPKSDQMTTEETSILRRVRSRVSDILPKWFSPSRTVRERSPTNESSPTGVHTLRRRRLSVDDNSESEELNVSTAKKMKTTESVAPLAASSLKRIQTQTASITTTTTQPFSSSTPTSVEKRRKLVGYEYNNKSSPYSLSQTFNDRVHAQQTETNTAEEVSGNNVFHFESPGRRDTTASNRKDLLATGVFKKDIKHRKSIHQSIDDGTNDLNIGSRKRLNIPFIGGHQPVDRSISEPPRHRAVNVFGKSRLNAQQPTTSATVIIDENDDDLDDDISINDIDNDNDERNSTANGEPNVTQHNNNESVSETSSDGCFSVPPMTTHSDLFKNRLINRHSSQSSGPNARQSSFMGNRNNMNLSASTGELNFSKHLETDKSLFIERNVHSAMSALNRPSFNASLYGSNSSLNSAASSNSRMFHVNSPFYLGKTMYGGASAATATYSRRDLNMHSALRVPVQMRPSSSLSNRSLANLGKSTSTTAPSTAVSGAANTADSVVLSSTAKRILDLMNQYSSPLREARKIGHHLNNTTAGNVLPGLVQQRQRFNEDDLKLSRSIRLNTPKTPYSRPLATANRNQDNLKLLSTPNTNELQVPQISQLLKMKRLQYNTEQVRQMASTSNSTLNKDIEYRLPTDSTTNTQNDQAENAKQTTKIKTKLTKSRADRVVVKQTLPEIILPNIQLPAMKSIPSFGIPTATKAATTPAKPVTTPTFGEKGCSRPSSTNHKTLDEPSASPTTKTNSKLDTNFKFSSPLTDISKYVSASSIPSMSANSLNNFKFSEPILSQTESALTANSKTNNSNINNNNNSKSNNNLPTTSGGNSLKHSFTFDPSTAKLKERPAEQPRVAITSSPVATTLKSGSVMDFLKPAGTTADSGFKKLLETQNSKWECSSCMSRNDSALAKCLCCNAAKPSASGSGSDRLSDVFKSTKAADSGFKSFVAAQNASKWECSACLSRNDNASDKCLCCSQAKPGVSASIPSTSAFSPPKPALDSGFKNLVAAQSSKWECSSCLTRNDNSASKCLCCEQAKPGAAAAPIADSGFKSLLATQNTGKWECSACLTRNENSRRKCVCCEQAKPGANTDDVPQFSFGSQPASKFSFGVLAPIEAATDDKNKSPTTSTTTSGGFSLGSKTTEVKTTGFSFGSVSSSSTAAVAPATTAAPSAVPVVGGFSFGVKPATESKGFGFGAKTDTTTAAAIKTATGGFTFGTAKPVDSSKDTIDAVKPSSDAKTTAVSPLPGFKFGQTPEKKDVPAPVISSAPTLAKSVGGFAFGSPSTVKDTPVTAATSASTATLPASFVFGSSPKVGGETKTAGFTFATPNKVAPSAASSLAGSPSSLGAFSSPKSDNNSSQFSFGSGKVTLTPSSQHTTPSITPTFGATFETAKKLEIVVRTTTASVFGSTTTGVNDDASKVFGSFGGASSTTLSNQSKSIFGAPAATIATAQPPAANAAFVFGSGPAKTEAPSFSFGSSTTASASTSIFGAATKPIAQQQNVPTFGTSQANTGFQSFSSFGQPQQQQLNTPTFGGNINPFGSSNNNTPTFGSTAASAPAATPLSASNSLPTFGSTGGFGNSGNVFGSGGNNNVSSSATSQQPSPFSVPIVGSSDEPTTKKFNFGGGGGGGQATTGSAGGSFVFGGSNANAGGINDANKPAFNFSSTAAPQSTFDFTNGTQGITSTTPFAFGGNPSHTGPQFQLGGMPTETAPNNAFQFSASNNPFAAQQTNPSQNPPRRKIKATRRLRQ